MAFEKKYMKMVKNIFPSKNNPEIQKGNIKDLIYFCNTAPEQLQYIGPYLYKKAKKNIKKKRYNYVKACIFIVSELVVRMRNILIFPPAITLMELLLNQSSLPELQIEATKTFSQYVSVQNDTSQFPSEIKHFIKSFVDMSKNNSKDDIQRRQIRSEGLKGISAYVSLLNLTDELDSFISNNTLIQQTTQNNQNTNTATTNNNNSHHHLHHLHSNSNFNNTNNNANNQSSSNPNNTDNIIFILLENMQYNDSIQSQQQQQQQQQIRNQNGEEGDDSSLPADVRGQALESLKDLSRRVENVTVGTLINSICNYLDIQQKWSQTQFSSECLKAVAESIKPQHYSILLTKYLNHLESPHPTSVIIQIVQSCISVVKPDVTVHLIITSLLKVLVRSIEVSNRPPSDVDEQVKLQSSIIDTLSDIAKKIKTSRSKIEMMNHIMNFLRDVQASYTTKSTPNNQIHGMNVIILDLVQCILQVASTMNDIQPPKLLNDLTMKLLDLSNNDLTSPESRIYIQKILQTFMLPGGKSFEQLIAGQLPLVVGNDGVDEYLQDNSSLIRDQVFSSFCKSTNQPNNIIALFKTLVILLFRGKNKEILNSVPKLFLLQSKTTTLPFRLSRSINAAITSYFLMVSKIYKDTNTLELYINGVVEKRNQFNQSCRYISFDQNSGLVIKNNKNKYNSEKKHDQEHTNGTEDLSVEPSHIAEILSNINSLTSEFPDIRSHLLSNKFSQSSMSGKDLQFSQDESTVDTSIPRLTNSTITESQGSSGIPMNRSNTIPVLAKSISSDSSPSSASMKPNSPVDSNNTSVTFDSFKRFTSEPLSDQINTVRDGGHPANNQRSLNGLILSKDLSYQYVTQKCEEVQIINQEYQQLLTILEFTEQTRQNHLKQQLLMKQQHEAESNHNQFHNINSISNTNTILNNDINPSELSQSCTLKIQLLNILE